MWKSFSWVFLATVSRQLAFLVVNVFLLEQLSRSVFGSVALAFSYMVVFIGLGDFGIRQIGWREIARKPDQIAQATGPLATAKAATVAMAVVLFVLLMPLLWEPDAPKLIYLGFGLGIIFNGTTFDFPFLGTNRMDLLAKFSFVAFALYCAGCVLLVSEDRRAWLVPVLFAGAMALLLALQVRWFKAHYGQLRFGTSRRRFQEVLRMAWPIGASEVLSRVAMNYPLILIGIAIGREDAGNYRAAELAYAFLAQLGHLMAVTGYSKLSHVSQHERPGVGAALGSMLKPTVAAAVVAGFGLILLGPKLLAALISGTTDETIVTLRVLGFALIVALPVRFLKGLLPSIDRQKALLLINLLTLSVGAIVAWIALPAYGIAGAAIGVVAAELATLIALILVYHRHLSSSPATSGS